MLDTSPGVVLYYSFWTALLLNVPGLLINPSRRRLREAAAETIDLTIVLFLIGLITACVRCRGNI